MTSNATNTYAQRMTLTQSKQYLESNELFLGHGQERPGAYTIVQTVLDVISHQENRFVGHLKTNGTRMSVRERHKNNKDFSIGFPTETFWKHRQLTADCSFALISSTRTRCLTNGNIGSCMANTLMTIIPSWHLARATLKNLVLPKLGTGQNENKLNRIRTTAANNQRLPHVELQLQIIGQVMFDRKYFRGRYAHQLISHFVRLECPPSNFTAIARTTRTNGDTYAGTLKRILFKALRLSYEYRKIKKKNST